MRESGHLAARVLDMVAGYINPGVSTLELNDICHDYIIKHNAIPAPLNYRGFPKSICTSINEVVCHGIPSKRQILKEGDIINVDITTILHGFHGDTSRTFYVGEVSEDARKIVTTCKQALDMAIDSVKVGVRLGDIGALIQGFVEKNGYSVVRDFVGHGIGRKFHEDPQVKHYGEKGTGAVLKPGMTFTIEPMINQGAWGTKVLQDKWTAVTVDGKLSAQFEHTIAIRSNGEVEILTPSQA
jgi:methionyl aminopeptidase